MNYELCAIQVSMVPVQHLPGLSTACTFVMLHCDFFAQREIDRDRERERETSKRSQIKFAPLKIQQDFLREGCTANNPSLWPESWHLSLSLPLPSPPPFPVWPRNGQC